MLYSALLNVKPNTKKNNSVLFWEWVSSAGYDVASTPTLPALFYHLFFVQKQKIGSVQDSKAQRKDVQHKLSLMCSPIGIGFKTMSCQRSNKYYVVQFWCWTFLVYAVPSTS